MENKINFKRVIYRRVVMLFSLLLLSAPISTYADTFQVNGGGGSILDNTTTTTTGTFSGISGTITSLDSVTIYGLNHTWVGDLVVRLSFGGQYFYLFQRVQGNTPNTSALGDSSNLNGTYTFVPSATVTIDTASAAGDTNYKIPAGNYKPAWQGTDNLQQGRGVNNIASLFTVFNGLDPNGIWTLDIRDNGSGDTGSFTGFQVNGTYVAVPEPASMVLIAAGAVSMLVARKKKTPNERN